MILGLGMDLVSIPRIEKILERFGERFVNKILTEAEQDDLPSGPTRAAYLAGRFAAKEAAVKALGTGFAEGVGQLDAEILSLPSGGPELRLHGKAREKARNLGVTRMHVSITHERGSAGAVVILEA